MNEHDQFREDEEIDVPVVVHPRPLNIQTQAIVGLLGLTIFGSGIIFGITWNETTRDIAQVASVSTPALPRTEEPQATTSMPTTATETPTQTSPSEQLLEGSLTGFYTTYELEVWDTVATCNAFVVTGGYQPLIDKYTDMVQEGNSVQRLDKKGRLVLNLPWDDIIAKDHAIIEASTAAHEVTINVQEKLSNNAEAGLCHSFVSFEGIPVE